MLENRLRYGGSAKARFALISMLYGLPCLAEGTIDGAYVKSLAAPGRTVFVIEYYDPKGHAVYRRGYVSAGSFKALTPVDIEIDQTTSVHLYGLRPCDGEMVNQKEGYVGSCAAFAQQQLQILLKSAKVIFCRAFLTEKDAAHQDATCFGYYNFPGSLDAVDNIEEQLVSLGALRLSDKPDGTPMRPDLVIAEKTGAGGFGMWVDPRVKRQ